MREIKSEIIAIPWKKNNDLKFINFCILGDRIYGIETKY